eukprot:6131363-Lingulodinium_polyedra.AAC.1
MASPGLHDAAAAAMAALNESLSNARDARISEAEFACFERDFKLGAERLAESASNLRAACPKTRVHNWVCLQQLLAQLSAGTKWPPFAGPRLFALARRLRRI